MSGKIFDNRGTSFSQTFPSKFNALPAISQSGSNSDRGAYDGQLVPVRNDAFAPNANGPSESAAEQLRQLEVRIHIAERSNQALLQELVRTQNEIQAEMRRTEEALRREQAARANVEGALRSNADLITQFGGRLQRADEQLNEGRLAVATLSNQLRGFEQATMKSTYEATNRRDVLNSKIEQIMTTVEESMQARNQLERTTFQLSNELQVVRGRVESQSAELMTLAKELKSRSMKHEMDNRMAIENIRRHNESQSVTEHVTTQLSSQVSQRFVELRDAILDLRTQQERDKQEVRSLEQQIGTKFSELQATGAEEARRRDEALHAFDMAQRERERLADTEHARLHARITDSTEDTNRRLAQREMKLKEENAEKFAILEKVLFEEQESRKKFEKVTKDDMTEMWTAFKKLFDEEMKRLRDAHLTDFKKSKENMAKLNEAIELMDQHLEEQKKHHEKLLVAEIQARQQQDRLFGSRLNDIEDKSAVSGRSLQETMSQLSGRITSDNQVRDGIMTELTTKLAAQTRSIDDMQSQIRAILAVTEGSDKYDILKMEIDTRMSEEVEARKHDVDSLQIQLVKRAEADSRDRDANQARVLELQENVSRLAETVESLKSVVGVKLQTEEKQRVRDVQSLQDEMDELRNKLDELSTQLQQQQRLATARNTPQQPTPRRTTPAQNLRDEDEENAAADEDVNNDDDDDLNRRRTTANDY